MFVLSWNILFLHLLSFLSNLNGFLDKMLHFPKMIYLFESQFYQYLVQPTIFLLHQNAHRFYGRFLCLLIKVKQSFYVYTSAFRISKFAFCCQLLLSLDRHVTFACGGWIYPNIVISAPHFFFLLRKKSTPGIKSPYSFTLKALQFLEKNMNFQTPPQVIAWGDCPLLCFFNFTHVSYK